MRALIVAGIVFSFSTAFGDLEPTHVVNTLVTAAQREASRTASDAGQALTKGDFNGALELADRALSANADDPWAHYIRAEALARLGRFDNAQLEYHLAEHNFGEAERWSHSIVIWGRANAFYQVGRCAEAKSAFADYIAYVKGDDLRGAQLAQTRSDGCRQAPTTP